MKYCTKKYIRTKKIDNEEKTVLGGALQIVLLVVSGVIYWPFIKMLDKQYISEENDAKENAE